MKITRVPLRASRRREVQVGDPQRPVGDRIGGRRVLGIHGIAGHGSLHIEQDIVSLHPLDIRRRS
jgi:hypothetical protein